MKKSWLINLTIVCTILGLLLSWQYNSFRTVEANIQVSIYQPLIDRITEREANIQRIEAEIGDLRSQLSQFLEDEARDIGTLALLQEYLNSQRVLTSLTSVAGPGIVITLNDNVQGAIAAGVDPATFIPENFIIHDWNILYVVNELRAAGAVAISINNQRITTSSEITCVGSVIIINGTRMPPPYVITALAPGNPEELKNRMDLSRAVRSLRYGDFPVEIDVTKVEIPEYRGGFRPIYLEREEQ